MVAGLYFTYGVFVVFTTINALRRPSPPTSRLPAIWILAMINGELPIPTAISRLGVTGIVWFLGGLDDPVGRTGLWLVLGSLAGIPALALRIRRAKRSFAGRADDPGPPSPLIALTGWSRALPSELEVDGPHEIADGVTVELYRRRDADRSPSPTLLYLHGGSWTGGDPHKQSRPLFHFLASRGWVVATSTYPLSPGATFPDHIIGVKRAISWLRSEGDAHGIDPGRIGIAGGSAGGHLASLAALTHDVEPFQPGFEDADTSVAACVSLYGIYDFLNRNRTRHDWPLIPDVVMKADPVADRSRFELASPLDHVRPDAVPFLVIHGSHDSLVPPAEARAFVDALRGASATEVEYIEIEGAQHAFDAVSSPRSRMASTVAVEFLETHVATPRHGGVEATG